MDPEQVTRGTVASSSSSLIFLDTGCSGALPDARCLIQPSTPPCAVCSMALSLPPDLNPNYRCNTSLLVDYRHDDGTHKYILIDVGKTFREQVIRWFVRHKVPSIDSVRPWCNSIDVMSPANFYSVASRFPNLVEQNLNEGDEVSRAAQLSWTIIEADIVKPFVSSGLEFVPLPVMHGEDYVCLGFLFGRRAKVAYLSDVSRILPRTEHEISKSGAGQLDLLILDTNELHGVGNARSCHLTLSQSLDAVKRICPKKALLIGMNHELEHDRENQMLAEWSLRCTPICVIPHMNVYLLREGIPVQLAHDGQRIFIDL
ncbi:hypothetical protein PR202_ga12800 [Eleusine coracana subsp. coracana]|uniref:Metallo-beta-lactamase domain-containing protein n=1 Tax=Eleusine coracana subsp. coracana TaxID=191504 RepID=A0AAV5CD33_ELECO|nr:hypothetical protein PR202_ga12800 [Eleusine coracana subsp. coracana]